jgi:hypothetical protein
MLNDGRIIITGGYEEHDEWVASHIYDPTSRSFEPISSIPGGNTSPAVLADGNVLIDHYSFWGEEWDRSFLYEPLWDRVTELDSYVGCQDVYRSIVGGQILLYCGFDGFLYDVYSERKLFTFEIEHWDWQEHDTRTYFAIPVPLDPTSTLLTNGIIGDIVRLDGTTTSVFNKTDYFRPPLWAEQTISGDETKIYFSGGQEINNLNQQYTVNESYMIDLNSYTTKRIADMWDDRTAHELITLADGNLLAISGFQRNEPEGLYLDYIPDVEIYVPTEDKWHRAGALNIGRYAFSAIQLRNGEIFIYGGYTDTGPGPYPVAPPEIGRCENINNN